MAAAVSRKSSTCCWTAPRHMVEIIAQRGRQYAGGPIGGRGDNLTTGGVFLVHCHGVNAHPVVDRVRCVQVHAALGQKRVVNALGAAFHTSNRRAEYRRWSSPVQCSRSSPARDAACHSTIADCTGSRGFIGPFHLRDMTCRRLAPSPASARRT